MYVLTQSFVVLTTVVALALGQDAGVTTSTSTRIYTAYGTSPTSSVYTSHVTIYGDTTTLTSTSRVTTTSPIRFTTIIPYTFLSTLNVTSTYRATTDVFTSTTTSTQYNMLNTTSTSYINVTAAANTTLVTESIVTIPTPSGFVPVDESSGDENYNGTMKRRDAELERDVPLQPRQAAVTTTADACYISIISVVTRLAPQTTSTTTVTSTKTSTQRPPRTVTQSTTLTVTNTVGVPDVPVLSTLVVTVPATTNLTQVIVVQTETTVGTLTSTFTSYTATRTAHLACGTDNQLGPRIEDGTYIAAVVDNTRANVGTGTNATSSYDCCAICQDAAGFCDFAYYDTQAAGSGSNNNSSSGNNCMLYMANAPKKAQGGGGGNATCSHAQAGFYNTNKKTTNRWVVINGPCGQLVHGNPTPKASSTTAAAVSTSSSAAVPT
ncbi:uncharacterized protein Z520_09259 [Fonsecaea multimorphosa CBS 102226]|uniref:Apple domain-containing protein n=1 Tax=Fonsecaea multimorphosa CBS 102226 TaxID=1442371 RepID=A0A0D2JWT3_9EURO|nr:uncharacterized protein Z520_09259 [Fonsecaea multimorphosa CBS 102226]KIX94949.1 hypothetical protein Z520_09259 [Fonsecaea multimorphosa CBS 102226]